MSVSAELGGLFGNSSREGKIALRNYGMELGIAFQIQDDLFGYNF